MKQKIYDVLKSTKGVKYIQEGSILDNAYDWMEDEGRDTLVEVKKIERHKDGTATVHIAHR